MNKTILFDLDGTIIDSTPAILDGFNCAFKSHNMPNPNPESIKALVGHPLDIMFGRLGVDKELVQSYIDAYKARYQEIYLDQTVLLNFAKEAVELASQIADVGVVTTKTSKFSAILLEHLGIMKYVKTLIGRDDVANPKPHPEPINLALLRLGKDADEHRTNAFMIGDTCMDMSAAKAANVNGLALLCGYGTIEILQTCSDKIFANPLEAVRYIQNL
ncbi:HAD family hydrolase [Campylobacter sp.]|uniref:HAD family hydrolase n=1 Tax=Campylobacter sp. TaxID=205 RepID=UPI0026F67ED1|nr:HAD family hydrolase [Campylobacter sp.]